MGRTARGLSRGLRGRRRRGQRQHACRIRASPAVAAPSGPVSTGDHAPAANFGKLKYTGNCLGCHGHAGKGQGVFPRLAGLPAAELAAKLKDYRAGKTLGPQSATMMPFAKALTDAEIDALAGYLAGL
jgi:cytochrome c